MKRNKIAVIVMIVAVSVTACSKDKAPSLQEPVFDDADRHAIGELNEFAFDLCDDMLSRGHDASFVFSPASIAMALGMEANVNNTQAVLDLLGQESLQQANALFGKVMDKYNLKSKDIAKSVANAVFSNSAVSATPENAETAWREYFYSDIFLCDFAKGKEVSDKIVSWIADNTDGMLAPESVSVESGYKRILVNAAFFNGKWSAAFDPENTHDAVFVRKDGSEADVRMMRQEHNRLYCESDGCKAVVLPYGDGGYEMTVVLAGHEGFDNDIWRRISAGMNTRCVTLSMPKFSAKYDGSCIGEDDLEDVNIRHIANIEVDESGTRAAASTVVGDIMQKYPEAEFAADRPFYYLITDKSTGLILFMGYYNG